MKRSYVLCLLLTVTGAALALFPLVPSGGFSDRLPPSTVEILDSDPGDIATRKQFQIYHRGIAKELRAFGPRITSREFRGQGQQAAETWVKLSVPVMQAAEAGIGRKVSQLNQAIATAKTPAEEAAAVATLRAFVDDAAREHERLGR